MIIKPRAAVFINSDTLKKSAKSAIIIKLNHLARHFKTIIFDNGKAFAEHERIAALKSTIYFTNPFASRKGVLMKT